MEIQFPPLFRGPYTFIFRFKERSILSQEDLIDMGSPYITPSLLLMNSLQEFLEGNKPLNIRNKAEFIGSVSKHIDEHPAQAVCSYLVFSFTH